MKDDIHAYYVVADAQWRILGGTGNLSSNTRAGAVPQTIACRRRAACTFFSTSIPSIDECNKITGPDRMYMYVPDAARPPLQSSYGWENGNKMGKALSEREMPKSAKIAD